MYLFDFVLKFIAPNSTILNVPFVYYIIQNHLASYYYYYYLIYQIYTLILVTILGLRIFELSLF